MATAFASASTVTIPEPRDFLNEDEMIVEFIDAPDLRELGRDLIDRFEELKPLARFTIAYSWRREGGKNHGDVVLGKLAIATGMTHYLTETDFMVWMAADHVRDFELTQGQIEAALYHQLCHGTVKKGRPALRRHDIEGFSHELRRYGTWTSELKAAKDAFDQAELPMFGPVPFGTDN